MLHRGSAERQLRKLWLAQAQAPARHGTNMVFYSARRSSGFIPAQTCKGLLGKGRRHVASEPPCRCTAYTTAWWMLPLFVDAELFRRLAVGFGLGQPGRLAAAPGPGLAAGRAELHGRWG